MNRLQPFPWKDDPFSSSLRVIVGSVDALRLHVDRADPEFFDRFSS